MATRRLARTALDEGVTNSLFARGVNTAKELVEHTPLDLSEMLDISVADANRISLSVAAEVRPEGSDALSLLIKRRSQPTHRGGGEDANLFHPPRQRLPPRRRHGVHRHRDALLGVAGGRDCARKVGH